MYVFPPMVTDDVIFVFTTEGVGHSVMSLLSLNINYITYYLLSNVFVHFSALMRYHL